MKDLGKTKFCLGLQIKHLPNGILVHQSTYTEKILKQFYMDKTHPLSTPMVGWSLDVKKDPFRPQEDNLADMFTMPLPIANFKKMVQNIGMR